MARPLVALLPWGDAIEDFLDEIGVSLDEFCNAMDGGWLFGYVAALATAGVDATVVCVSRQVGRPERRLHRPTGAPVWLLPQPRSYRRGRRVARRLARRARSARGAVLLAEQAACWAATPFRALTDALRAEGVDAIICQEYDYTRFEVSLLVGRRLGIPVVATFQGGSPGGRLALALRRRTVRRGDGLVIASQGEADRVIGTYGASPHRVAAIPNPIDTERWAPRERGAARRALGLPSHARIAAWHGRVDVARKGLDVLVESWGRVCGDRPGADHRLLLLGTGPDSPDLRRRLAASGAPGVHWCDEYVLGGEEVRLRLAAADVFVLPSRHEGFAVAPLEAMASGRPVVAAAAPGVAQLLGHGDAGLIVPCGDVEALAGALGRLLDAPRQAEAMGAAARVRAETMYSLDAVGSALATALAGWGLKLG
ncbi:MAG: glycosyltransferase family 4 protein [Actinomycetota bacterium]|nr:glycosyltransferase family 4 protein [Actinomycetota bacterium]